MHRCTEKSFGLAACVYVDGHYRPLRSNDYNRDGDVVFNIKTDGADDAADYKCNVIYTILVRLTNQGLWIWCLLAATSIFSCMFASSSLGGR
jgi:hypothetical protein